MLAHTQHSVYWAPSPHVWGLGMWLISSLHHRTENSYQICFVHGVAGHETMCEYIHCGIALLRHVVYEVQAFYTGPTYIYTCIHIEQGHLSTTGGTCSPSITPSNVVMQWHSHMYMFIHCTYLVFLQGLFEPIWCFVDLFSVSSHTAQSQIAVHITRVLLRETIYYIIRCMTQPQKLVYIRFKFTYILLILMYISISAKFCMCE